MTKKEREHHKELIQDINTYLETLSPNRRIYQYYYNEKKKLEKEILRSESYRRWQKRRRKNRKKKAGMK